MGAGGHANLGSGSCCITLGSAPGCHSAVHTVQLIVFALLLYTNYAHDQRCCLQERSAAICSKVLQNLSTARGAVWCIVPRQPVITCTFGVEVVYTHAMSVAIAFHSVTECAREVSNAELLLSV
jgi:hypothetical protein